MYFCQELTCFGKLVCSRAGGEDFSKICGKMGCFLNCNSPNYSNEKTRWGPCRVLANLRPLLIMSLAFLCSSTETEPHSLMDGLDRGSGVKVGWSGFCWPCHRWKHLKKRSHIKHTIDSYICGATKAYFEIISLQDATLQFCFMIWNHPLFLQTLDQHMIFPDNVCITYHHSNSGKLIISMDPIIPY